MCCQQFIDICSQLRVRFERPWFLGSPKLDLLHANWPLFNYLCHLSCPTWKFLKISMCFIMMDHFKALVWSTPDTCHRDFAIVETNASRGIWIKSLKARRGAVQSSMDFDIFFEPYWKNQELGHQIQQIQAGPNAWKFSRMRTFEHQVVNLWCLNQQKPVLMAQPLAHLCWSLLIQMSDLSKAQLDSKNAEIIEIYRDQGWWHEWNWCTTAR